MNNFLNLASNISAFRQDITETQLKHFPFVVAQTLTNVAQGGQRRVQDQIPHRFDVHSRFTAGGVRTTPASKQAMRFSGHTEAMVRDIDPYMVKQEFGGARILESHGRAVSKGKAIAIPIMPEMQNATGATKKKFKVMLKKKVEQPIKRKWGKHHNPKAFVFHSKFNGVPIVAIRTTKPGKGERQKDYKTTENLFVLARSPHMKQRFDFYNTVSSYASKEIDKRLTENMINAVWEQKNRSRL